MGGIFLPFLIQGYLQYPSSVVNATNAQKQKKNEWRIRLQEDIRVNKNGMFTTLTFSDESIKELSEIESIKDLSGYELDNAIARIAVRRFYERHRKKYKKSIRHWLVTEIGHNGTENIHLHGIIWTDLSPIEIEELWGYGHIMDGRHRASEKKKSYISGRSVTYITKYLTKKDLQHKHYKPIMLTSNGIGKAYLDTHNAEINRYKYGGEKTREYHINENGYKIALPVYLRNNIYSEDEREKLWIEKLDAGIMWIDGKKYNIKTQEKEYMQELKRAQKRSEALGYGNRKGTWDEKKYEEDRRKLKQQERITKAANRKIINEENIIIELEEKETVIEDIWETARGKGW